MSRIIKHLNRFFPLLLVIFAAGSCSVTLAQSTAILQGTVKDPTGAFVANASVVVRSQSTGEERGLSTDAAGLFQAASLTPGLYTVEVKSQGLQSIVVSDVLVEVGRVVVQNFTMNVASTSEVVQITATVPVLETGTVSVGQVISSRTVQEIPLNGRHFVDLGLLIPGSVTPPQNGFLTAPLRGQGSFAFNTAGNREDTVNFMINGVNLNDLAQNQITFQPSINTVQEFKVDNSTYAAEYGRSSGAIVNIATRSGSNDFHGEVFEFLRNNALDARNYFNVKPIPQSPFKRNQFGAALGGPIQKDKTFFFASYEGLRQRQGLTISQTVLSDAQRNQAQAIANPTVVKLLQLIPQANVGSKFVGSATAPVDIDQGTINVSRTFGQNDRVNVYYAIQRDLRTEPSLQGNNIPGFGDSRESRRQIFTFNETHIFTANLTNEARLGYNRIHIVFSPNAALNPSTFGINNGVTAAIGLPQITLRDILLNFGGPSTFPQGRGDYTAVLSDTLAWLHGKHSLKFGGEFRRGNNNNFQQDPGTLAFTSVDDFINGRIASLTVSPGGPNRIFVSALGGFVQDSWKVLPRLTFELGFRYEWNGTPVEAKDRFAVFDPSRDWLIQTGTNGIDKAYYQNNTNFLPHAGFAYDIRGDAKWILRGAYAIQSDQPVMNTVSPLASNPPFATPVAFNGPGTIGFANAITAAAAAGSLAPTTINRNFINPWVQSRNLNLQHQFTDSIGMMIGYFGSSGEHLRVQRNINQFINGARPYPALAADSPIAPGKGLGNISLIDSGGNSQYNALWITGTKRFSSGLQFDTSYTWSKSIDTNSLNSQGTVIQNSYNLRGDRGLSDFDARHRFVLSGLYELPFKGNRLAEGWQISTIMQFQSGNPVNIINPSGAFTGVANSLRPNILGSVPTGYTPAGNGNIQYFPSLACGATVTSNCLFQLVNGFGSLGRNVIIGPGFQNIDFSLFKNIRIIERLKAQFRFDVFDLFNKANFGQPNRSVSTAPGNTFGQISNTRFAVGDSGSSRQIQLALKLIF